MSASRKPFYGWYILVVCVLVMAICYASIVSCVSLFTPPITKEFGFAQSAFTLTKTISSLTGMAVAPFFGRWMAKKHMHALWVGSLLGVVVAFSAMPFATTLPMFYAIAFLQGLFTTSAAMLPVNIVLTSWFKKKRGLIISIAMAGSGIGGTVLSKVIGTLIATQGWRFAYFFLAALVLVVLVPAVALVIRRTPEEKGLQPYGADEADAATASGVASVKEWNIGLKELWKQPIFYVFICGILLVSFTSAVVLHIPSAVVAAGYSVETAATMSSIYLLIAVPGKLLLGWIYDKFGVKAGLLFGNGMFLAAMVALLFIGSEPVLYLMALLYGFGTCVSTVAPSILTSRTFGTAHYSEIFGITTMLVNGGYAIGAPVIGLFFDLTGSYALAWVVMAVLAAVMTVLLIASYARSRAFAEAS